MLLSNAQKLILHAIKFYQRNGMLAMNQLQNIAMHFTLKNILKNVFGADVSNLTSHMFYAL